MLLHELIISTHVVTPVLNSKLAKLIPNYDEVIQLYEFFCGVLVNTEVFFMFALVVSDAERLNRKHITSMMTS